jgi:hypothetical protein
MGKYNEILVGRYNRSIQKLFGMKGPAAVAQLASDIQVAHNVMSGVENRLGEGWRRYSIAFNIGPTVAQTEAAQVKLAAGSNIVAVIESIILAANGAAIDNCFVTEAFTDPANQTNTVLGASIDPRQGSVTGSSVQCSTSAGGAADLAVGFKTFRVPTTSQEFIQTEDQQWTLLPTQAYRFRQTLSNSQMFLALTWRERFLEESERT